MRHLFHDVTAWLCAAVYAIKEEDGGGNLISATIEYSDYHAPCQSISFVLGPFSFPPHLILLCGFLLSQSKSLPVLTSPQPHTIYICPLVSSPSFNNIDWSHLSHHGGMGGYGGWWGLRVWIASMRPYGMASVGKDDSVLRKVGHSHSQYLI